MLSFKIKSLIEDFMKEYEEKGKSEWGDRLSTLANEQGNCSMISSTLVGWLRNHHVNAKTVTGVGATNRDWTKNLEEDSHTVVLIGDTTVDLTARQFARSLPFPRIVPLSQFKKEWSELD